jgi:hypothetical protein
MIWFIYSCSLFCEKAQTRRDKLRVEILIMTVLLHQQGHENLANLRRMASSTSSEVHLVHLLASLKEQPTGANDLNNSE